MNKSIVMIVTAMAFGLATSAHAAVDEAKAKALAQAKNCFSCHAVDKKLVGPSFQDIGKKYDDGQLNALAQKVIKGSSGVWGPIPMPPNPVSEAEAKTLVEWILSM